MSYFNTNIAGSNNTGSGLLTKFDKRVVIGSNETAEVQIDLSTDIVNYDKITNQQIIVDIVNISASEAGTASITHTYDANSGILTIKSNSSKIPFVINSTVEITVYVAGAVQLQPQPDSIVYYLGQGTSFNIASKFPTDFKNFTKDNFIVRVRGNGPQGWAYGGSNGNANDHAGVKVNIYAGGITYDAPNGMLTVSPPYASATGGTFNSNNPDDHDTTATAYTSSVVDVYLVVGDIVTV